MKKEEVYLDLTKLTKNQLINVAENVEDEMHKYAYNDMSKGILDEYIYLIIHDEKWECSRVADGKLEITYNEFLSNFGKQQPQSITLPIEDYNRLGKLELKAEIKRLKKELKGL